MVCCTTKLKIYSRQCNPIYAIRRGVFIRLSPCKEEYDPVNLSKTCINLLSVHRSSFHICDNL